AGTHSGLRIPRQYATGPYGLVVRMRVHAQQARVGHGAPLPKIIITVAGPERGVPASRRREDGGGQIDREQALAYRVAAQQLDRTAELTPSELAVIGLGAQDTPYGSARLALAARTTGPLDDDALVLIWAARGAPHLHRGADLPALAAALWPLSD